MAQPLGDGYGSVGPVGQATTLTTNANNTLDPWSRAIYVATVGTLQVTLGWTTVSLTMTVLAGSWLPIRVQTVHACPAGTLAFW